MSKVKRRKVKCNEVYCVTCGLCNVACSLAFSGDTQNAIFLDKNYKMNARNSLEKRDAISFMNACKHCEEPECVKACVTGAVYKRVDGIVAIDGDKCIGCWSCMMVCPHKAIKMGDSKTNKKISIKCDLCADRETQACIDICPNKALAVEECE